MERQIKDGNGDIIELKRARNSLLSISTRVPPEILGEIFSWNLVRPDPDPELDSHFDGFCKGSYNFLLVCHRWFQVASHTPKLWTFCGNALRDWEKWFHRHPQSTYLDLVLNDGSSRATQPSIDHTVQDALKDRAARDVIRQVHLCCRSQDLLSKVISLLTPEDEGIQWRSIESIDLRWGAKPLNVSKFFTRVHLPRLRTLLLHGPLILYSWDHLAQQTTVLTTLSLHIHVIPSSPPPTTSHLFSILVSNPGLEVLSLEGLVIPGDYDKGSVSQVTLRHLKKLSLGCEFRYAVGILDRLVFPYPLNSLEVTTSNSAVESVLQTLGSFVRLYFQSNPIPWDRIKLEMRASYTIFIVHVENEHGADGTNQLLADFKVLPAALTLKNVMQNLCHDFIAPLPQERVYYLRTSFPPAEFEDMLIAMPKIETLELLDVELSEGFLQPNPYGPHLKSKLLLSLRSLRLNRAILTDYNWDPLVVFLRHQTSAGQTISLSIVGTGRHMCLGVAKEIRDLVGELTFDLAGAVVPVSRCHLCEEVIGRQNPSEAN